MSEQNYSSYASGEERRPRSRSGSGQRSGDGPRRPKKGRGRGGLALRVIGTLLLIAVTTGAILCCFGAVYVRTVILPKASLDLGDVTLRENSVMYYEDDSGQYQELGQVLTSISSQWVEYEEIPEDLKNAAIAIEDRRFLKHNGVDWWRTAQAVFSMFTGGDIQGGSTITQQLIKNLTEDNETTVKRKVTEIFRALEFDRNYDKDTTLLWYLNVIPLGAGCEGVGAAAEKYFGKPVSELTLAECASLIAITNNPSKYGPYSLAKVANSKGELWDAKQWNKYRQELILNQMLKEGYITQEEHDQAVAQELVFVGMEAGSSGDSESPENIYSWYEEQVISDVIKDLKEKYDYSDKVASQMLASGGLRIYTCIDPEVQKKAEAVYGDEELLNYVSKSTGQRLQSAITIIDNETGDIAALVGRISGMTTAGKTGTTDTKDNRWFVGYTPYYTAAVWVGYETPERVPAPGNPAAQVFKKVMTPIHEGLADRKFPQVSGLVSVSYCMDCGGEAIEACQYDARGSSRIATGYVFPEDRPSFVCSCHSLEEGSNSMVRVCVDDPILDANGEFTGFYRAAGPFCPEVSVRTLCYLNLDRESVGGAVARDSSAFYSAYLAAAGGQSCTVHSNEPSTEEPEPGAPEEPSEPGTDDPALPPDPENSGGDGALINPDTGVPYGY